MNKLPKKKCIVCDRECKRRDRKFCSHKCYSMNKHDVPWNKGKKLPYLQGENSNQWKGNNAKYTAKHMWVQKMLGKPLKCTSCKSTIKRKYEWANISGEYKRDLEDWIRLCTSCHRRFDETWLIRNRDVLGRFI